MKRVKAACIMQTLTFLQKDDAGLSYEQALEVNRREFEHYKMMLESSGARYVILDEKTESGGSITVHVKKQYNSAATSEYFD